MTAPEEAGPLKQFRRYLVAGIRVCVPLAVTPEKKPAAAKKVDASDSS